MKRICTCVCSDYLRGYEHWRTEDVKEYKHQYNNNSQFKISNTCLGGFDFNICFVTIEGVF